MKKEQGNAAQVRKTLTFSAGSSEASYPSLSLINNLSMKDQKFFYKITPDATSPESIDCPSKLRLPPSPLAEVHYRYRWWNSCFCWLHKTHPPRSAIHRAGIYLFI